MCILFADFVYFVTSPSLLMLSHIEAYLHAYLPQNLQQAYMGLDGIHRVQYCLNLLGNPQHRYQVFHVAGTSGK